MEIVLRFVVGGLVVSVFAILADALEPKSFAGLLGAAPSVALATMSLTVLQKGKPYAAIEAQSMVIGAIAFLIYACLVANVLVRGKWPALSIAAISLLVWLCSALGLWYLALG